MVGVLILTHGPLADELLEAAATVHGLEASGMQALCLDWDVSPEEAIATLRRACDQAAGSGGLLILTDMYGGTPHNVARQLTEAGSLEVVTGVNLPMVVRLCCRNRDERPLAELVEWIVAKGRASICRSPGADGDRG